MKRFILATALLVLGSLQVVYASSIALAPTTVSVTKGQTFTVSISANPAGVKSYTVKSELSFPATMLEVVSFTPASGWLALTQPGYDSVDNVNGKLIKTAGFTGGFTDVKSFGSVTFKAKASGSATIAVQGTSLVLDAMSKNTLSGTQGSSLVTIADVSVLPTTPAPAAVAESQKAKAPAKKATPAVTTSVTKKVTEVVTSTTTTSVTATSTNIAVATSTATTTDDSDAVAAVTGGNTKMLLAVVGGIIVLLGLGWFVFRK